MHTNHMHLIFRYAIVYLKTTGCQDMVLSPGFISLCDFGFLVFYNSTFIYEVRMIIFCFD